MYLVLIQIHSLKILKICLSFPNIDDFIKSEQRKVISANLSIHTVPMVCEYVSRPRKISAKLFWDNKMKQK